MIQSHGDTQSSYDGFNTIQHYGVSLPSVLVNLRRPIGLYQVTNCAQSST
jgi:hypothetical protein